MREATSGRPVVRHGAVILAVAGLSLFLGLGRPPLHHTQEARVIEVAREMGESGDLILPRFCGEPRLQKPPLACWLALAGFRLAGGPVEWGGRLYSALSGTFTALLIYALARSMGRPRAGLAGAVVWLTAFLVHVT